MTIEQKFENLLNIIRLNGRISVAFSGGIDSTFLLYASKEALGKENVIAVTIKTPYISERDYSDALDYSKSLGIEHFIIEASTPEHIKPNPVNRCYYCKQFEFKLIIDKSTANNVHCVAAGLNTDDPSDYRPGISAMKELKVRFPLQEAGLSKPEIRALAKQFNIPLWNKPANACLLSRIPYGDYITEQTIDRIQEAEKILQKEGFINPRVRTFGTIACIEIEKAEIVRFAEEDLSLKVHNKLIQLGYSIVTIDIMGYRTGSMNEKTIRQFIK